MLKEVLGELLGIADVQSAAVSGLDGFVIEMVQSAEVDIDAIGAMGSWSFGILEKMGNELGKGKLKKAVLEHANGHVILYPLTNEEFLVVTARSAANVGRLVYELDMKKNRLIAAM